MTTTTTPRLSQIADDLCEQGAYTSANSVIAVTKERDDLLAAALPFCNITETATASLGEVTPAQVNALREAVGRSMTQAEQWMPKERP
jgi:hypothetical protein